MGDANLPAATFKNISDEYNFSSISNLFINDRSYALITHWSKMCKMLFHEALRNRVKTFRQNLLENYSKTTKLDIIIRFVNFQKLSGRACPRTSLEPFLFLNMLQINSTKKIPLIKCRNSVSLPRKKFWIPPDMKHFQRAYLHPILGLTSLHLVNVQPNSKLHSPTKNFWMRSCSNVTRSQWNEEQKKLKNTPSSVAEYNRKS